MSRVLSHLEASRGDECGNTGCYFGCQRSSADVHTLPAFIMHSVSSSRGDSGSSLHPLLYTVPLSSTTKGNKKEGEGGSLSHVTWHVVSIHIVTNWSALLMYANGKHKIICRDQRREYLHGGRTHSHVGLVTRPTQVFPQRMCCFKMLTAVIFKRVF